MAGTLPSASMARGPCWENRIMLKKNRILLSVVLAMVLTISAKSVVAEERGASPQNDHYKCYPVRDWGNWEPRKVTLEDQFGKSRAKVVTPRWLCNPVDKNGEGVVNKKNHLVCYGIKDDPAGPTDPIEEVVVKNQFGEMRMWVGVPANSLCLPSSKIHIQD